jgi:hypothetical protein
MNENEGQLNTLFHDHYIKHWIDDQRAGLAATILNGRFPGSRETRVKATAVVEQYLQQTRDRLGLRYATLSTLEALQKHASNSASRSSLAFLAADSINMAITSQKTPKTSGHGRICVVRASELAQNLAFHGTGDAELIRRGLISTYDRWLNTYRSIWQPMSDDVDASLTVIRSPWICGPSTLDRLEAVARVATTLYDKARPDFSKLIASGMFDRLHARPLLVFGSNSNGYTVPVGVDVQLADDPVFKIRSVTNDPEVYDWGASQKRIIDTAKEALRASQAAHIPWINQVQVTLDFRIAEKISEGVVPLTLDGNSAEVLIAGVIFSRLLGLPATPRSVATGSIGPGEYSKALFIRPAGARAKIAHAYSTGLFDRILAPQEWPEMDQAIAEAKEQQTAAVIRVKRVATALNTMVGVLAQPHRYIRCPELALLEWGVPRELNIASAARLAGPMASSGCVFNIATVPEFSWTANEVLLYLLNQERLRSRRETWLFVRIYGEEDDYMMWQVILEALGEPEHSIDRFLFAASPSRVAERLRDIMVNGRGPPEARLLAPRTLVLVGGSERFERDIGIVDKSAHNHSLAAVLSELQGVASRPFRIVLAPIYIPEARITLANGTGVEPDWLDALRVFRGSWNIACGSSLIERYFDGGKDIRDGLRQAVREGWLEELPDGDLVVTHGRGKPNSADRTIIGGWHASAAQAFSPQFAEMFKRTALPASDSEAVVSVLEACYHFKAAAEYDDDVGNKYKNARYRMQRLFVRRGSVAAYYLSETASSVPAPSFLKQICVEINKNASGNEESHPYVFAAISGCGVDAILNSASSDRNLVFTTVFDIVRKALQACDTYGGEDRDFVVARVTSNIWNMFNRGQSASAEEDVSFPTAMEAEVSRRNNELLSVIFADEERRLLRAPDAKWYCLTAERESDHSKAAILAGRCILAHPFWINAWPLFLGAFALVREPSPSLVRLSDDVRVLLVGDVIKRAREARVEYTKKMDIWAVGKPLAGIRPWKEARLKVGWKEVERLALIPSC